MTCWRSVVSLLEQGVVSEIEAVVIALGEITSDGLVGHGDTFVRSVRFLLAPTYYDIDAFSKIEKPIGNHRSYAPDSQLSSFETGTLRN